MNRALVGIFADDVRLAQLRALRELEDNGYSGGVERDEVGRIKDVLPLGPYRFVDSRGWVHTGVKLKKVAMGATA